MKKGLLTLLAVASTLPAMVNAENVFLSPFKTTHEMTPFDKIDKSYYEEAIDSGIAEQRREINAIVVQRSTPDFENTIVALENAGATLNRVLNVFYPLLSSNSDDELMEISNRVSPKLSELSTDISLNEELWKKVKYVYDNREKYNLDTEDMMLLQKTYDSFARSGANLVGDDRAKYKKLSAELSELTLKFGQNALKATNQCEMWITENDLDGLPESAIEAYKLAAKKKGREGEYLVTVAYPSYSPFMKYSTRQDLREKLYRLYNSRGISGEFSNMEVMSQIAQKRMEIANLMGYKNYADFVLERRMAQNTGNVYNLLNDLREAYTPVWKQEYKELCDFASKESGHKITINPWDYSFWSNKLKDAKYSINDEELRPYFELSNTIKGVFGLATKLYGLHFTENQNIIVFHPEVKGFDVTDADGNYIGIIYTDFFPRESKRAGAWMTGFKDQRIDKYGNNIRPHVSITMNFTRPTASTPALLTFSEVETFLHEFGHAIHGLLANTKYSSLSGTSVYRDFVELPSQFNENYLVQKEFLDGFARHYQTGEPMPQELIDRVIASSRFGAGYACLRQLGFGFIDMAWHTIEAPVDDAAKLEEEALKPVACFPAVDGCLCSPQFSHIFSGGYAAGYYSYKWAEVLDADAFAAFKETGIFNQETAKSFKDNILTKGGTEHPMTLYKRFRGHEPTIEALLERDGVKMPKTLAKKYKSNKK